MFCLIAIDPNSQPFVNRKLPSKPVSTTQLFSDLSLSRLPPLLLQVSLHHLLRTPHSSPKPQQPRQFFVLHLVRANLSTSHPVYQTRLQRQIRSFPPFAACCCTVNQPSVVSAPPLSYHPLSFDLQILLTLLFLKPSSSSQCQMTPTLNTQTLPIHPSSRAPPPTLHGGERTKRKNKRVHGLTNLNHGMYILLSIYYRVSTLTLARTAEQRPFHPNRPKVLQELDRVSLGLRGVCWARLRQ